MEVNMEIRLLQNGDQVSIQNILAQHPLQFPKFVIKKYPERWANYLNTETSNESRYFVAIVDNQIVGHAGYIYNKSVGLYELVGVAVAKDFQVKGIGKALISVICESISVTGEQKVFLYTLDIPENHSTLVFYRKIGFEAVAHEKDFFAPTLHRVTFEKSIY